MKKYEAKNKAGHTWACGKILLLPLLIALCSLLISCDLFNSKLQDNYLEKIDEEIRWTKAAKLNVRIDYPSGWGTSNPSAGQITPSPMDIRQGYAFELEFIPDAAYQFAEWRAYDTAALNAVGDWRLNTTLLDVVPFLSGVDVPVLSTRGGKGEFTVNTVTPVTLVPWCMSEPYVTRIEPRGEGRSTVAGSGVVPSTAIVVYFSTVLDPETVFFGPGSIEIKARHIGDIVADRAFEADWSGRFENPVYENKGGQNTVTIIPKTYNLPEENYQIEVTIGPDIRNAQGEFMTASEVFYYRVSQLNVYADITSWSATYNAGAITVNCGISGANADSATVRAYYQMNQGFNQDINSFNRNGNSFTGTIPNAGNLDFSGVRDGRNVSNTREYRIIIELSVGGSVKSVVFKIWNFPGMKVDNNATADNEKEAIEIFTADDLKNIPTTGLGMQYVLANDITVSTHNPIANFSGKFYGNGNTITINGINATADMGLFSTINGGTVRDLTVEYNISVIPTTAFRFGGIAGTTQGNTQLINVLLKGSVAIGGNGNTAYAGGLVGLMTGTSSINNAYSNLNLTVNTNPGASNSLFVGGVAGSMEGGASEKVSVVGNITVGGSAGTLRAGGLAGSVTNATKLTDMDYRQGFISITSGDGPAYLGGAIGRLENGVLNACSTSGNYTITKTGTVSSGFNIGGFVGIFEGGTANNCYSASTISLDVPTATTADVVEIGGFAGRINAPISYCYAKSEISVTGKGNIYAGGFTGNSTNTISKCYASGNVNVISQGADVYAGGFAGALNTVEDSYALGNIFADNLIGSENIYAGGLVGRAESINCCFAAGSVIAQRRGNSIYAGGIAGCIEKTLTNSNALGTSVTSTGAIIQYIKRVDGSPFRVIEPTRYNNRGNIYMRLYQSSDYAPRDPPEVSEYFDIGHDTSMGENAQDGNFRDPTWWQRPASFSGGNYDSGISGPGFSTSNWDFTTVAGKRYPILRASLNGSAMGGQL